MTCCSNKIKYVILINKRETDCCVAVGGGEGALGYITVVGGKFQ